VLLRSQKDVNGEITRKDKKKKLHAAAFTLDDVNLREKDGTTVGQRIWWKKHT
jgi:hypothetical protein